MFSGRMYENVGATSCSPSRTSRGLWQGQPIVGNRRAQITPNSVVRDCPETLSQLVVSVILYRDPVRFDARPADGQVDVAPVARSEDLVGGAAGESLESAGAQRGRRLAQFDVSRRASASLCG